MRWQISLKIHSHWDLREDGANPELHPLEVHLSLPKYSACNLGLAPGKDFFSLLPYTLLLIAARLHFVFVNHAPLCRTARCMDITRRIKAQRPSMTLLAVCISYPNRMWWFHLRWHFALLKQSATWDFTPHSLRSAATLLCLPSLPCMKWFLMSQLRAIVLWAFVSVSWLQGRPGVIEIGG